MILPCAINFRFVVGDDERFSVLLESAALFFDVSILDARPRFAERDGRRGQILRRGDEHGFAVRRGDDAFVHEHKFLKRAFEIVAERGVGTFRRQPAIIGLHEIAFADFEAFHFRPDLDDAHDGFVSGHDGFFAGDIMRHLRERVGRDAGDDFGFARVAGKLFEQFQIGEAQAADFDLAKHLMRPGLENGLGFIDAKLVGPDQLHRALFFRNSCH